MTEMKESLVAQNSELQRQDRRKSQALNEVKGIARDLTNELEARLRATTTLIVKNE